MIGPTAEKSKSSITEWGSCDLYCGETFAYFVPLSETENKFLLD
jgi:hypothetical protein